MVLDCVKILAIAVALMTVNQGVDALAGIRDELKKQTQVMILSNCSTDVECQQACEALKMSGCDDVLVGDK